MKRKSRGRPRKYTVYSPFDLFGEIPVTHEELVLWCKVIAKVPEDSWRFDWYVQNWDVAGKIRAAKARMPFDVYLDLAKSLL
jgi:hypothetical protein